MAVHVTTAATADGPIVRKTASDERGIIRLADEARRIRRAGHPGVVPLRSAAPGILEFPHVGAPLHAASIASVDHLAAVAIALTATLADLHRLGLAHNRIDDSHVLLTPDGRPMLCGFAEATLDDPVSMAADVAALGRLIDTVTVAVPQPRRRWARSTNASRLRAALAETLAADPARRPTASHLVSRLRDAVPTATFPAASRVPEPSPSTSPGATASSPDIDSRLGAASTSLSPFRAPAGGGDRGGPSPAETTIDDRPHPPPTTHDNPHPPPGTHVSPAREARPDDVAQRPPEDTDPVRESTTLRRPAVTAGLLRWRKRPGGSSSPRRWRTESAPWGSHRDRRTHRRVDAVTARLTRLDRRAQAAVLGMLMLLGIVVGLGVTRTLRPSQVAAAAAGTSTEAERSDSTTTHSTTTTTGTTTAAAAVTAPEPPARVTAAEPGSVVDRCEPVTRPGPDFDRDGCPDPISVSGTLVTVGAAEFEIGEPGDIALLGDWRCDGLLRPGLLRPATGEVFSFADWTRPDALTVDPVAAVPDGVAIRPDQRCGAAVVVDGAGGTHRVGMMPS